MKAMIRCGLQHKFTVLAVVCAFLSNIVVIPSGFAGDISDLTRSKKSGLISRYYSLSQVLHPSFETPKKSSDKSQLEDWWKRLSDWSKKKGSGPEDENQLEEGQRIGAPPVKGGGRGKDKPPVVSSIASNAVDVDSNTAGEQVYNDTVVTYSAQASDPEGKTVSWQWSYTVNGGSAQVYSSGVGQVLSAVVDYTGVSVPATYNWSLRVSDGVKTATKSYSTGVVAHGTVEPPPPGPLALLYLDFNGDFASSWGSYSNISTPAFDQDGNLSSFSAGEMATISEILQRVAEKYSPFNTIVKSNFDYPTGEPTTFGDGKAMHVIIGGSGEWTGGSYGGVAYLNSFTNSLQNSAYVFENNLGNGNAKYTAEAITHEAGHTFGLAHHSAYDASGNKTAEYSQGTSLIAPIMGNSYYASRGLWVNDRSTSYTTFQDDLAIITSTTNGFGYRPDDYGDDFLSAHPFAFGNTFSGIIEQMSDLDIFSFSTLGGSASFSLSVAQYGAMLDSRLELWDTTGHLLYWNDPVNTSNSLTLGASLGATLAAGDYYLAVSSHGGYGDIGQYKLLGSVL